MLGADSLTATVTVPVNLRRLSRWFSRSGLPPVWWAGPGFAPGRSWRSGDRGVGEGQLTSLDDPEHRRHEEYACSRQPLEVLKPGTETTPEKQLKAA
jgi:hypothetical protein